MSAVSVVLLAYGDEPQLRPCIDSVLASDGVDIEIVLVDNGANDRQLVDELAKHPRIDVVRPETNLGYAGGCNLGAARAQSETIAFINSDAIVERDTIATLIAPLQDDTIGLTTGCVRLADEPDLINAAGNPLNILGVVWAGHYREPAASFAEPCDVTLISGAAFACRKTTWSAIGGFDDNYFMYHEDTDLSVRCWQRGLRVRYVPDAIVLHHYEFSRNPRKLQLLERNRLVNLLVLWQARTLLLLLPALLGFELAMLGLALKQRWLGQKLTGYRWIWLHREHVRTRRAMVQRERIVSDRQLAPRLTPAITAANVELPGGIRIVNALLSGYWSVVRRLL